MSGETLVMLFARQGEMNELGIPSSAAEAILRRKRTWDAGLRQHQLRCEQLMSDPENHGNLGYRQRLCAEEAWNLLVEHWLQPTSTATGLFHKVTRLLYEGMTGHEKADLMRACRAVYNERKMSRPKLRKKNL
jgi:hypothetical protein